MAAQLPQPKGFSFPFSFAADTLNEDRRLVRLRWENTGTTYMALETSVDSRPAAALLIVPMCVFTVDRIEYVYLTQFGGAVATFMAARSEQAGLHFKWPWPIQSVQRLDRRLHYFDLPGAELLTRDPKRKTIDRTLTIDAYVCRRIADSAGVDSFIRSVGTPAGASDSRPTHQQRTWRSHRQYGTRRFD